MDRWLDNLLLEVPRIRCDRVVALGDSLTDVPAERGPNAVDHVTARMGIAYRNLAVSGSTTARMVEEQLPSAVAQRPTLSFVWIGGNDFLTAFFDGTIARGDLAFLEASLAHLRHALDALCRVGSEVVVANLTDLSMLPLTFKMFGDQPEARAWIRSATLQWNDRVAALAAERDVLLVDLMSRYDAIFAQQEGLALDGGTLGVPPNFGTCADLFHDAVHPSAVSNGFVANAMMETMNLHFGTRMVPLRDHELAAIAGLHAPTATEWPRPLLTRVGALFPTLA